MSARGAFMAGVRLSLGATLSYLPFGVVCGVASIQAGMSEVLTKPFTLQQLAAQLKRVIMTAPNVPPAVRREALARLRSEIGDEIFEEVVAVYLEETPLKVARIIEAAAAGELASVASAATTFTGVSSRWITVVTISAYMNATAPALKGGNFPV